MSGLVASFALFLTAFLGMFAGASFAVWLWLDMYSRYKYRHAELELNREMAVHEIDAAAAKRTLARVRAQRTELLTLLEAARKESEDRRTEALAREQQIRRQVADSGFGVL